MSSAQESADRRIFLLEQENDALKYRLQKVTGERDQLLAKVRALEGADVRANPQRPQQQPRRESSEQSQQNRANEGHMPPQASAGTRPMQGANAQGRQAHQQEQDLSDIAEGMLRNGRAEEAIAMIQKALRQIESMGGDNVAIADVLNTLVRILSKSGRHKEAVPHARRAHQLFVSEHGHDSSMAVSAQYNLALALAAAGDPLEAEQVLREVLSLRVSMYGREHTDVAQVQHALALVSRDLGKHDNACDLFKLSRSIWRHQAKWDMVALSCRDSSRVMLAIGDVEEAIRLAEREVEALEADELPMDHPRMKNAVGRLAHLRGSSQPAQAQPARGHQGQGRVPTGQRGGPPSGNSRSAPIVSNGYAPQGGSRLRNSQSDSGAARVHNAQQYPNDLQTPNVSVHPAPPPNSVAAQRPPRAPASSGPEG